MRPLVRESWHLVGHVGHIADQEDVGHAAAYSLCMADHIVHGDWQGAVVTQHGHAQAVTNQDHVPSAWS